MHIHDPQEPHPVVPGTALPSHPAAIALPESRPNSEWNAVWGAKLVSCPDMCQNFDSGIQLTRRNANRNPLSRSSWALLVSLAGH